MRHVSTRMVFALSANAVTDGSGEASVPEKRLPPGQHVATGWPVVHYGPVPRFRPEGWQFQVFGATRSGHEHSWGLEEFADLPTTAVTADMHCVTRFSVLQKEWEGVPAAAILEAAPPESPVTHVMVWAEYGYSANVRLSDFAARSTVLATHQDGHRLTPDHGYPLRLVVPHLYAWKSVKWLRGIEYLVEDRRGFWEDRGYHNVGDAWLEQRYAHQEDPGDGPRC